MLFQRKKANDGKRTKETDRYGNERMRSLMYGYDLSAPMDRSMGHSSGKVSFCTFFYKAKKASLAVETAIVLPLFFLGLVTIISFTDIYKIQTEHLTQLCEKAKEAGMYAYSPSGNGMEEITLPYVYSYRPVGGLVKLPEVRMYNTVKVHAWTGAAFSGGELSDETGAQEEMVYVTETGSVYHKNAECTYLNLTVKQVSGSGVAGMRNQYGEKYHACENCSQNQSPAGVVYVTETGNRYHNLETCSGLKRTVMLVKHSHAGNMSACSRCGQEGS